MMSNKGDSEKRLVCPYNVAHVIIPHRLQTHLVKCRKNYPDTKMVLCMYNSNHRIYEPELAFHHDNCYDRLGLDKFIFAPESDDKFHVPKIDLEPTETWEDDDRPSYNPEEHCLNNPVLRKKDTLSKAKRRNFRWEERQRMQQFQSDSSSKQEVQPEKLEDVLDSHPRRPNTISKGMQSQNNIVEDDVNDMLKKIHLGANTATVPPRKPQNLYRHIERDESENVYPSNTSNYQLDRNEFPSISHSSRIQSGNGVKSKAISRGRGSAFRTT